VYANVGKMLRSFSPLTEEAAPRVMIYFEFV